jgi:RecA-family ATPase
MNETPQPDLFITKQANEWIKDASLTPAARQLFGALWYEREICILFADTNVGKSALAFQMGNAVAAGGIGEKCDTLPLAVGPLACGTGPKRVVYVDFELDSKQFASRYSTVSASPFPDGFLRAEPQGCGLDKAELYRDETAMIWRDIEEMIVASGSEVLIIDNITYMASETEKAKYALPLMKRIKQLRNKYDLSILLIAHTPKRDASMPLNRNDLQGSKMLINFCDSSFTIGESDRDPHLRYIKQIKCRQQEIVYGEENVILCFLEKNKELLGFTFVGYGVESQHLFTAAASQRNKLKKRAIELSRQGRSLRDVGGELGVSRMTVSRWLESVNQNNDCHILEADHLSQ